MIFMSFSETPDDVEVLNVFEVTRPSESRLNKSWNNLFHASRPENYLGILSRLDMIRPEISRLDIQIYVSCKYTFTGIWLVILRVL